MYFSEKAKQAAAEIVEAYRNPLTLVGDLARLVMRRERPSVVSDTWSYRNQLIVLLRGYSEARGYRPWMAVGRKVSRGQKAFYIMAPILVHKKKDAQAGAKSAKAKKATRKRTDKAEKMLIGYRAVPVFGLEQTEPAENWRDEKKYHPFGETEEYVRVFHGYKQPWYRWYEAMLPESPDQLTAVLGAAIVAKLLDQPTELQDLLNRLGKFPVEEIAERIDKSCRAVVAYLDQHVECGTKQAVR